MTYTLKYMDKDILIDEEKCGFFLNDEDQPIEGFAMKELFEILNQTDAAYFDLEYYDQRCEACGKNQREGSKYYKFLECHFYLFAKGNQYVMSSLSLEYEYKTLPDLLEKGIVDGSYLISINVCPECGDYTVDLEYGLF